MSDVLDYLVDKGNMNVWSSISSKKFFRSFKSKGYARSPKETFGFNSKMRFKFLRENKRASKNFQIIRYIYLIKVLIIIKK